MSEHEHPSQIGQLAEHYSRLKDEVSHIDQRVDAAQRAYQVAAVSFRDLDVHDDHLGLNNSNGDYHASAHALDNLLGSRELIDLLRERTRLHAELGQVRDKLRSWLNYV
jgi:hypothetical protein